MLSTVVHLRKWFFIHYCIWFSTQLSGEMLLDISGLLIQEKKNYRLFLEALTSSRHKWRTCVKLCQKMNQSASSPVSDVYRYIIIIKLLESICDIWVLTVLIYKWKIQTYWVNTFLTNSSGYVWLMHTQCICTVL